MGKNTTKKLAFGTVIAAIVGYLAGILTAPKSGKETRGDIKDAAAKGVAEAEKEFDKLHTELQDLTTQAKAKFASLNDKTHKELDDLLSNAKDAKAKASEVLGAVRKGSAEDKDLKKAIADASKAIEHLREYLSK